MQKSPPPFVWAIPDEKNILTWHYILRGPPDSPYHGGEYYGQLQFPADYPFKPPGIKMHTPSGRFQPDKKICTSMSDYHPGTWNPAWSVATILTGLLSFMLSDEITTGSVTTTDLDKKVFARKSHEFNRAHKKFRDMFPEYSEEQMRDLPNMGERDRSKDVKEQVASAPSASAPTAIAPVEGTEKVNVAPIPAPAQKPSAVNAPGEPAAGGWMKSLRVFTARWRYIIVIALAVLVSRLLST